MRLAVRKLSEWASKIGHLMGEKQKLPKRKIFVFQNAPRLIEEGIRLMETGFLSAGDLVGQVTNLLARIAETFAKAMHQSGEEEVATGYLKTLEGNLTKLVETFQKAADKFFGNLVGLAQKYAEASGFNSVNLDKIGAEVKGAVEKHAAAVAGSDEGKAVMEKSKRLYQRAQKLMGMAQSLSGDVMKLVQMAAAGAASDLMAGGGEEKPAEEQK